MSKNREYELQCLLELLSSVINNEPRPEWLRDPDWRALYKLADYHHVANTIYGMIIGMDSRKLIRWRDSFEERFRYSVIMQDKYRDAEKLILKSLEKHKVHCLDLEETVICGCYTKKEHHYPLPISFLVEAGHRVEINEAMEKLDFTAKQVNDPKEEEKEFQFYNSAGVSVIFYERFSFTNKKTAKYFSLPPQPFRKRKGCKYVHVQDVDDFYIYYIAQLAEKFARGSLEIRDVMDLWQYYQLCFDRMEWKIINKELKRLDLEAFSDLIVKMAATWFGNFEGFDEESILLSAMERYIISKGTEARQENEAILPLVKEVADIYVRDMKRERRRKTMEMLFPERSYMEAIYPVLSKHAFLLPACWLARLSGRQLRKVKYFFSRIGNKIHDKTSKVAASFKEFKDVVKKRFVGRDKEKKNEDEFFS